MLLYPLGMCILLVLMRCCYLPGTLNSNHHGLCLSISDTLLSRRQTFYDWVSWVPRRQFVSDLVGTISREARRREGSRSEKEVSKDATSS